MSLKQVEVAIMGQSYKLSCRPEEEAALHAAVAHVDREMCAIRDIGKIKARDRIAVLSALNIAHALLNPAASAPSAAEAGTPEWKLQSLVTRIDRALAHDNQLL